MVPGKSGFDSMDTKDYGLVELPSEERHGFIWAVLTADATIDLDAHLGDFGPNWRCGTTASYGYHTEREFNSDVSWKGALEAFAEGYHFPFVHGQSLIGQNTLANTMVYDEFGKHHRIGFPFNWITNLQSDPAAPWDPRPTWGSSTGCIPTSSSPTARSAWRSSTSCPPVSRPAARSATAGWAGSPPTTDDMRARYDAIYEGVHAAVRDEDFAMLPQCGEGVRHGQHDHMIIGRNEIAVQHMIKVFAQELGVALA